MGRTVLIVDDSEAIRTRVRDVLDGAGVGDEFILAADGAEGFKRLLERGIDIVLCDVIMPGLDGFKFLGMKKGRPELADVPVVMLTGQESIEDKIRCLESGASDYLTKPFHDAELLARVKVHLHNKELRDRLEKLSNTDPLTTLPNRRYFLERASIEWARCMRYENPIVAVMVDLDHFKKINDSHGHVVGDRALKAAADVLLSTVRVHDIVCRYGGEEFAVLLPQTDMEGGQILAERCREAIQSLNVNVEGVSVSLSASFGVACATSDKAMTFEDLMDRADSAMYAAKKAGRNRVELANSD